jgi:hypothetical protein
MSRQLGSALGVAILIAIIGHPSPGGALGAFGDGWTFMIGSALVAGAALLAVGPVRIGGAEPHLALVNGGAQVERAAA